MTTLYLIAMSLPLCIASVFEAGNIGSSSGTTVTVPIAPTPGIALAADLSDQLHNESWVFW